VNLVETVGDAVAAHPERPAIVFKGRERTYESFWSRAGRFAQALVDRGYGAETRVAVYLPNLPQFVTTFHGTLWMGGVVVPLNPQYRRRELEHRLSDSNARVVVTLPGLVEHIDPIRDKTDVETIVTVGDGNGDTTFETFLAEHEHAIVSRANDDVACQPYTSGTTGTPKGVLLTHENLRWDADAALDPVSGGVVSEDRHLGVLPLFHIYGMTATMNATLFGGAAYYPVPEWNAREVLELIEEAEITLVHAVPAMYNDMVNEPGDYDLSSIRFANAGGSALPREVLDRFEERFDIALHEGYGLTETSPVTHANRVGERRMGSIGRPLDGVDAMVVDDDFVEVPPVERGPVDESEIDLDAVTGELVVSGPNVMKGYYDRPEANREAFTEAGGNRWFHTGDVCYRDEDDYYYIVDRKKHVIVTAGYNVYPSEVENLLYEHPEVTDAAVVGVPDDRRGETVKAFVVVREDATVSTEEIKQYCLERLAPYKHPREVEFVEELPRTATGKIQKFELNG